MSLVSLTPGLEWLQESAYIFQDGGIVESPCSGEYHLYNVTEETKQAYLCQCWDKKYCVTKEVKHKTTERFINNTIYSNDPLEGWVIYDPVLSIEEINERFESQRASYHPEMQLNFNNNTNISTTPQGIKFDGLDDYIDVTHRTAMIDDLESIVWMIDHGWCIIGILPGGYVLGDGIAWGRCDAKIEDDNLSNNTVPDPCAFSRCYYKCGIYHDNLDKRSTCNRQCDQLWSTKSLGHYQCKLKK